jgi:hypothetical protein
MYHTPRPSNDKRTRQSARFAELTRSAIQRKLEKSIAKHHTLTHNHTGTERQYDQDGLPRSKTVPRRVNTEPKAAKGQISLQRELIQKIRDLEVTVRQLEAEKSFLQAENSAPPKTRKLKMLPPNLFTGNPEKKDDGTTKLPSVEDWIESLEAYLSFYPADSFEQQILFTSTLLQGKARTWYRFNVDKWEAWDDFVAGLRLRFKPVADEELARKALKNCRQTRGVSEYVDEFQSYSIQLPNRHADDELFAFMDGLRQEIRMQVALQRPQTLAEAVLHALTVEPHTTRLQQRPNKPIKPSQQKTGSHETKEGQTQVATNATNIKYTKLTETERAELLANGGCFYCRVPHADHMSMDCPKKKTKNQ